MLTPRQNRFEIVYGVTAPSQIEQAEPVVAPVKPEAPMATAGEIIGTAVDGSIKNATRLVNLVSAVSGAESARIASEAVTRQRSGKSGLADLLTVAQQGVQIYDKIRSEREVLAAQESSRLQERQDAADKEQREIDQANFEYELTVSKEQLLANAPGLLRSEGGLMQYQRQLHALLRDNEGIASPASLAAAATDLYAPIQRYMSQVTDATLGTVQQEQDAKRTMQVNQMQVVYSGKLAQIEQASTPEQQDQLTNEFLGQLHLDTANMNPYDRALVVGNILGVLREKYDVGSTRYSRINSTLTDIQNYNAEVQRALDIYENGDENGNGRGDMQAFNSNEAAIHVRYPVPSEARYNDPLKNVRAAQSAAELQNTMAAARDEALLNATEALVIEEATVIDLAYTLYSTPSQAALYDATLGNNPQYLQAKAIAQNMRDHQTTVADANNRILEHQTSLAKIDQQNVESTANWLNSQASQQPQAHLQMMSMLLTTPGLTAAQKAAAEQYVQLAGSGQAVPPEVLRDANQAVIEQRQVLAQLYTRQIASEQQRIVNSAQPLRAYGLDTPAGIQQRTANARTNLANLNNRINAERQRVSQQQGQINIPGNSSAVSPDFNKASYAHMSYNGTSLPTPLAVGSDAGLTGGDGRWNQYRTYYNGGAGGHHRGLDIGAPTGTPTLFYANGTVEMVGFDGEGYGNFIDIRTPDGYLHRFAHLDSVSVKQGQTVTAQQQIGRVGNTGGSQGEHLHWEVRPPGANPSGYGEADTMNPFEYMAGLQSRRIAQPRNGGSNGQPGVQQGRGQSVPPNSQTNYSPNSPMNPRFASMNKNHYQRSADGSANYGYAALERDRNFRVAMHRAAAQMNMPAQWLADVMGTETGGTFASDKVNEGTGVARGIIQFIPSTVEALGVSWEEYQRYNNVQQLALTVKYLEAVREEVGLRAWTDPYQVMTAVWGGGRLLSRYLTEPNTLRDYRDEHITWQEYHQRLGRYAGRRYPPLFNGTVSHDNTTPGCPTCAQIATNNIQFFAHTVAADEVYIA